MLKSKPNETWNECLEHDSLCCEKVKLSPSLPHESVHSLSQEKRAIVRLARGVELIASEEFQNQLTSTKFRTSQTLERHSLYTVSCTSFVHALITTPLDNHQFHHGRLPVRTSISRAPQPDMEPCGQGRRTIQHRRRGRSRASHHPSLQADTPRIPAHVLR